jgi:hypothetical protein
MNGDLIFGLIGTTLGGGALGAFITSYFSSKSEDKKTEVDATDRLISQWENLLEPLRSRVAHLEKELDTLRGKEKEYLNRISVLETQLILFESSHIDIPLPMWMKDVNGKMVYFNKLAEDAFLIPMNVTLDDYIGKTDHDVWKEEIANEFTSNDKEVMRNNKEKRVIERYPNGSGDFYYVDVLKYPRTIKNKVIGVAGVALSLNIKKSTYEAYCNNK